MNRRAVASTSELFASDRTRLQVYRWLPCREEVGGGDRSGSMASPRALVVIVHGIIEHSERYAEMAGCLNRAGIAVWAADLRGHGRSSGSRVWVDHFDRYLDDVSLLLSEAHEAHPDLPIFLFGHSMGGLIALQPRFASAEGLVGLVVSAPPLHIAEQFLPWLRQLAAFGSRWFPWARIARMGCSAMSRDAQVVADFRCDPLVYHGRIPTRTGAEIIRVGEETRRRAAELKVPILLLQGTGDAVVLCQATEAFYQAVGSGDKTLRLFPGLYHDLPREPEREAIFNEITHWILRRC